jgi:hypothetical protein
MLALLLAPILITPSMPMPALVLSSTSSTLVRALTSPVQLEACTDRTEPWSWMQTPTPATKPNAAEALIPASSMFILRFESVDAAVHAIEPYVPGSIIAGVSDPIDLLKLVAQTDLQVDQIDSSRPIVIAWRLDDPELPPAPTIILTCKDPAAFTAPLTAAGWTCTTSGKIVACSSEDPGPALAADSPLRAGLDRHDVVLRIAMNRVMDQFGDDVRSGIDEIAQQSGPASGKSKAGVSEMFGAVRDAIDSIEMFDVGLSIVGDQARATLEMTAGEGSSLAGVEKVDAKNLPAIARLIDPDASIACITALDFTKFMDAFQWALDAAAEEVPEAERAQFDAAMKTSRELYELAGPTMGMSGSIDDSGLHAFGLMSAPDAGAYMKKMVEVVKTTVPWMKIVGPDVSQVDGVDVSTFHFEFDFAAMPQAAGQDEAARKKAQSETEKTLAVLFGEDGMAMSMASKNGALVFGLGGTGEMHTAFARMDSKSTSSTGAEMLELLGRMNPGVVYHFDIARLMDGFMDVAKRVEPSKPMPGGNEIEAVRAFPPMTIAAGVEGRVWRLVFAVDAAKMQSMVARFSVLGGGPSTPAEMTSRDHAIEDIGTIVDALEEYAGEHSGKYPDTLAKLLEKNAEGEAYLEELPVDPWGRAYLYDPPKDEDSEPRVYTLGADGKVGGEGDDEDLDNDSE